MQYKFLDKTNQARYKKDLPPVEVSRWTNVLPISQWSNFNNIAWSSLNDNDAWFFSYVAGGHAFWTVYGPEGGYPADIIWPIGYRPTKFRLTITSGSDFINATNISIYTEYGLYTPTINPIGMIPDIVDVAGYTCEQYTMDLPIISDHNITTLQIFTSINTMYYIVGMEFYL
jgi:hypothetical protein